MKFCEKKKKKKNAECADFPHGSIPVVVLGASPLKIGVLLPAKKSANFSGRAPKVKAVLRESGHVGECVLSGTVVPGQARSTHCQ